MFGSNVRTFRKGKHQNEAYGAEMQPFVEKIQMERQGRTTDSEKQFVFKARPTERRCHGDGVMRKQHSSPVDGTGPRHDRSRSQAASGSLLSTTSSGLFAERTLG